MHQMMKGEKWIMLVGFSMLCKQVYEPPQLVLLMKTLTLCTRKWFVQLAFINTEIHFISLRSKWQALPRKPWAVPEGIPTHLRHNMKS